LRRAGPDNHCTRIAPFSSSANSLKGIRAEPQPKETTMTAKIVGNKLVIEIPLNPAPVPSSSGKTLVIASTHGNKTTEAQVNGKNVVIGLNAYIPKG
jgi:hypothetical protein